MERRLTLVLRVSSDKHPLVFPPAPVLQASPLHQHPVTKTTPHNDPPAQTRPSDPRPRLDIDRAHLARAAPTTSRRRPTRTDEGQEGKVAQDGRRQDQDQGRGGPVCEDEVRVAGGVPVQQLHAGVQAF